jgi:hypothetical protein
MKKRIADYFYKIIDGKLFITDLNLGNISLTNSIEAVLEELQEQEKIDVLNMEIVQIDSEGEYCHVIWDGRNVQWRPLSSDLDHKYKQLFK